MISYQPSRTRTPAHCCVVGYSPKIFWGEIKSSWKSTRSSSRQIQPAAAAETWTLAKFQLICLRPAEIQIPNQDSFSLMLLEFKTSDNMTKFWFLIQILLMIWKNWNIHLTISGFWSTKISREMLRHLQIASFWPIFKVHFFFHTQSLNFGSNFWLDWPNNFVPKITRLDPTHH